MATFYLDLEGGNDSNDGTSFANRWKTFDTGATAARVTAGDTVRVMSSPDPTSLGITGVWTTGPKATAVSITSSTNATPIVVTATSHGLSTGDTVYITGHTTNTNANGMWQVGTTTSTTFQLLDAAGSNSTGNGVGGASGTCSKVTNMVVKLASALTQNVALCGNQGTKTNWTASSNVTCTLNTTGSKEGIECEQIAVGASFATGLAAYFPTGTLNLSGYQQLSFWIQQTSGTIGAASSISLKLCSDALGATPVNTFNIPALGIASQWVNLTVNLAGNLGSSIQSIAFYVNTDNGAQTFLLDNIFACKASSSADSLTLSSLISKNSGDEAWYNIQSINGTRVVLDQVYNTAVGGQQGYSGVTETVTTYKRETVKPPAMVGNGATIYVTQPTAGTASSRITFSCGWDRTNMSTQTGETWLDGQNGTGKGLTFTSTNYITVDKLNFVRCQVGLDFAGAAGITVSSSNFSGCVQPWSNSGTTTTTSITTATVVNCSSSSTNTNGTYIGSLKWSSSLVGINLSTRVKIGTIRESNNNAAGGVIITGPEVEIDAITSSSYNTGPGLTVTGLSRTVIGSLVANNNTTSGILNNTNNGVKILGGSTSGNTTAGCTNTTGTIFFRNFTFSDSTPLSTPTVGSGATIYSEKNGGTADSHVITTDGGTIVSATDQRHTASGISWKFRPTSTVRTSAYPLSLSVAKVAVAANAQVSASIWVYRDSTQIQGKLMVLAGQLSGVSETSVSAAPSINTWTQYTLNFTPTEAGVIELKFRTWDGTGTTNNLWIDDLTITQA